MQNYNVTKINEFFAHLENTIDCNSTLHRAVKLYMDEQRDLHRQKNDGPFLTVVTRTQGKRREMLNEMMLCLTGQSDTDFEFILVGHNLTEEGKADVTELVDELPLWLREKTTFLPIQGGTRTTPLIEAFNIAKGQYVAVLDDDDIVFDNWVAAFKETAQEHPGKIIHAYSVRQDWETVGETQIPRCADAPANIYCRDFNYIKEFVVNVCPLMSLAFPLYAYKVLGIHFDEDLTTTEDWDFLMRTASITGVANNSSITSVYRFWKSSETSQTLHNKKEWDANYEKIVERFQQFPKILSSEEFESCVAMIAKGLRPLELCEKANIPEAELFYDDGIGFTSGRTLKGKSYDGRTDEWIICFDEFDNIGAISALRYDPQDMGGITVDSVKMKVVFADDTEKVFKQKNILFNGYTVDEKIVFLKSDPQFVVHLAKPQKIKKVLIGYNVQDGISDEILDLLVSPSKKRNLRSVLKKIIKKLLRK